MGDLLTHGAHPYMNLFEGNVVDLLFFDGVHGSSSHNTAFATTPREKAWEKRQREVRAAWRLR